MCVLRLKLISYFFKLRFWPIIIIFYVLPKELWPTKHVLLTKLTYKLVIEINCI